MPSSSLTAAAATSADVLRGVLAEAAHGRGSVVVGEVGAGRTRLLAEVAERLQRTGRRARALTATASSASVPFGVLLPLLDPRAMAGLAHADAIGRAALLRTAVLGLDLQALLLDEAGLLDPGSAAVLLELAQGGVVVVATVTPDAQDGGLTRRLVAEGLATRVALPPLALAECEAVAEALLGAPLDESAAQQIAAVSAGNPGRVLALLHGAVADGALVRSGAIWVLTGSLRAPRSLRRVVERRFRALDAEAAAWIAAVAVAEQVGGDVAAGLGHPGTTGRAAAEAWIEWDDAGGAHRVRQRALQAAVVDLLGTRERRAVLRRLLAAHAAVRRPLTDVERAAAGRWRLELGDPLDGAEALRLGLLTSLADPAWSERFLRAAIDAGADEAHVALAEQLKRTSRITEAEEMLGAARPTDAHTADRIGGMLAIVTGIAARRPAAALAVLDARIEHGAGGPESQAVRIALLLRERRLPEALAAAVAVGEPRRADFASVFAGMNEVLIRTELGASGQALRIVDALHGFTARTTERIPEGPVSLDWLSGWVPAVVALDIGTAAAIAERNHARMVETGMHAARVQFAHLLAVCRTLQGEPGAAVRLLQEAEASPGIWRDSWLPRIVGALVEAHALVGDLAAADAALGRLTSMTRAPDHEGAVDRARARLAAARGDLGRAAALSRGLAERALRQGAQVEAFDGFAAALGFGDDAAAVDLLALGPVPGGRAREMQRAQARSVVAGDLVALDAVAARFWHDGHRLLAIEAAADAQRRRLAPDAAAAARLALWRQRTPSLAHVDRAPATGDLTDREREVARLVAAGRTDREVADRLGISLRTAQTHLGRVHAKLGIHRRADLAALLPADATPPPQ